MNPLPARAGGIALAVAFVLFLFFFRLGDRPLRNPDEGRYAEIARAMLASGDWVTPRLYAIEYLRKPVLFYWLVAASFKAFGAHEWSARLVPALFGMLGVGAVFVFARRRWGETAAGGAALILSTNLLYLFTSRYLVIDAVFAFFIVTALFLFYEALENAAQPPRRAAWLLGAFALLGFSFLAKGPVGVLITIPAVALYGGATGRFPRMFRFRREAWIVLVFATVALPWFFVISRREPEFLRIFFWHENFGRATSSAFEHQEPWFYYFVLTPLVLLPWSLFPSAWRQVAAGLKSEKGAHRPLLFCLLSAGWMTLFYSLSKGKLHTYLVPALPFWAILLAWAWRHAQADERFWSEARRFALLLAAASIVFILAVRFVYEPRYSHRYPDAFPGDLKLLGGAALAGCIAAYRAARRRSRIALFASWGLFAVLTDAAFLRAMDTVNSLYSTRPFAEAMRRRPAAGIEMFLYGQPGAFYDFAFYLGRRVKLVGLEGEFELMREEEGLGAAYASRAEFEAKLAAGAPLYVMLRRSDYDGMSEALRKNLRIIRQDSRKILATTLAETEVS